MTTTTRRRLRLTQHAVRRYQLRVKPALDLDVCEIELSALAEIGAFQEDEPFQRYGEDVEEMHRLDPPDGYIELAPKIWAIVAVTERNLYVVLTVMVDGSLSPPRRKKRNEARRVMRQKKQAKRKDCLFYNGSRHTRHERWQ